MGYEDYARVVKMLLVTKIIGNVSYFYVQEKDVFIIRVHLSRLRLVYEFSLHPFYIEGVYPIIVANVLKDKIVNNILNEYVLTNNA